MSVAGAYSRHRRHDTRPSSFQVWSWFFMRISGLALVFLGLAGVFAYGRRRRGRSYA